MNDYDKEFSMLDDRLKDLQGRLTSAKLEDKPAIAEQIRQLIDERMDMKRKSLQSQ